MEEIHVVPPSEIQPLVASYRAAAKTVGGQDGNLGAFRPWYVAKELAKDDTKLAQKAFEIFIDPPKDALFPDTHEFIERLKENPDLDFAIWTQGEMNADAPEEQRGRGFQEMKIEVSDIEKHYNKRWNERLKEVGLSVRTGALNKTAAEFFETIITAFGKGGYDKIVLLDDKEEKLNGAREQLKSLSLDQTQFIHVNRKKKEGEELVPGEVRKLSEVSIPSGRVLVLCDYDGTLSDTEKIKADHEKRLGELD